MDFDTLPIVCLGTATRIYSYGMIRAVNFGTNARFVMFDVQHIGGKYCRVPNLVLDVPLASVAQSRVLTDEMFRRPLFAPDRAEVLAVN